MWVFLDDQRESPIVVHNNKRGLGLDFGKSNKWIYARNYDEFVDLVSSNFDQIELISFDHDIYSWEYVEDINGDLKPIEKTGKDAAQFVVDFCMDNNKKLPDWFVHSDNTNGNKNIRILLLNYMFRIENRIPRMVDSFGYVNGIMINNR
jgi:hypothetical protein